MTEKLYYLDSYMKEFSAVVEEAVLEEHGMRIRLDRTAFYPEGGGQGSDVGILELPDGRQMKVTDVQEIDGEIWHFVSEIILPEKSVAESISDNPAAQAAGSETNREGAPARSILLTDSYSEQAAEIGTDENTALVRNMLSTNNCFLQTLPAGELLPGTSVTGRIDWIRRFDHMQQHSGEHIVSGMICSRFHCDNVGFHLGEDTVTIDFNANISMEQAQEIENQANQYIWEDHPVVITWPTEEELATLVYRSKKELSGAVRIASFPGADRCACCGTHVSGSAQVGLVKFLSAKNFHDGTRLELLCGKRAADFLSMNYQINKKAAVLLSTSEANTADRVQKLLEENTRLKAEMANTMERMFRLQAEALQGRGDVLVIDEHLSAEQARILADLIADCCGGMAAVFARAQDRFSYAVIRKNSDISAFVKELNKELQGRGGGRDGFAQGSVTAGEGEIREFFRSRNFLS